MTETLTIGMQILLLIVAAVIGWWFGGVALRLGKKFDDWTGRGCQ